MAQLLDAWCAVITPYPVATGREVHSIDLTATLLCSSLHGQLGLWRNVSQEAGEDALEELRDALLVTLFGRSGSFGLSPEDIDWAHLDGAMVTCNGK
ncbi:hypothetical protein [Streptomyces sp. NPDC002346]